MRVWVTKKALFTAEKDGIALSADTQSERNLLRRIWLNGLRVASYDREGHAYLNLVLNEPREEKEEK